MTSLTEVTKNRTEKAALTGRWGFHRKATQGGTWGQICPHLGLGGLGGAALSLSFPVCTTELPVPGPRGCLGDGRKSRVDGNARVLSSHQSDRPVSRTPPVLRVRDGPWGPSACVHSTAPLATPRCPTDRALGHCSPPTGSLYSVPAESLRSEEVVTECGHRLPLSPGHCREETLGPHTARRAVGTGEGKEGVELSSWGTLAGSCGPPGEQGSAARSLSLSLSPRP